MNISKDEIKIIEYVSQLEEELDYAKELSLIGVDRDLKKIAVPPHKCCDCVDIIKDMVIEPNKEYYANIWDKYAKKGDNEKE